MKYIEIDGGEKSRERWRSGGPGEEIDKGRV